MTAEHLRDYRETAAIYLRKSLEANANDPEVKAALGEITGLGAPVAVAESRDNSTSCCCAAQRRKMWLGF